MLARARGNAKVFGFDSFQGLPEDWQPGCPRGKFAVDQLPECPTGASFVVGLFEDTLPTFPFTDKVTLVHIDCDLGSSTRTAFRYVRPHLAVGSYIVFDELWGYDGFEKHEMRAFYETCLEGLQVEWLVRSAREWQKAVCRVTGLS
jgi:hypothetical protein